MLWLANMLDSFASGLHNDISLFAHCFYAKQKMFESPNVIKEMEPLSHGCTKKARVALSRHPVGLLPFFRTYQSPSCINNSMVASILHPNHYFLNFK